MFRGYTTNSNTTDMITQSIAAFLQPHTSSPSMPVVARAMYCLMRGDFSREDFPQVLNAQLDSLAISSQAKQNIIPTLLGIAGLAKVQLQGYVRAALSLGIYHGHVYVLAHPRRHHYRHPGWIPSSWRPTPEPLIKCASDPSLLVPEVVTPSGILPGLVRASLCRPLSRRPRPDIFMYISTFLGTCFYTGCSA